MLLLEPGVSLATQNFDLHPCGAGQRPPLSQLRLGSRKVDSCFLQPLACLGYLCGGKHQYQPRLEPCGQLVACLSLLQVGHRIGSLASTKLRQPQGKAITSNPGISGNDSVGGIAVDTRDGGVDT